MRIAWKMYDCNRAFFVIMGQLAVLYVHMNYYEPCTTTSPNYCVKVA